MNSLQTKLINEILPLVNKPARYVGNEYNAIHHDHTIAVVKVALAFPDIYEIAMSHLGLKILYDIINRQPNWLAERVFAPWIDMEMQLRKNNIPLYTLESFTPLNEFDIIGFSLQHELADTNVVNMLDLANIPIFANERTELHPLVIAGGPCAYNPEPMTDFIDAFVIGDGEDVFGELIEHYITARKSKFNRHNLLRQLAKIEGIYVPSLYQALYAENGKYESLKPLYPEAQPKIQRRYVELETTVYPTKQIVPYIETVHDRIAVEIQRGCTRGCRFCQTGFTNRPRQERTIPTIVRLAEESLQQTGFDELSLLSLSTSDYSEIRGLVAQLMKILEPRKISLSLPSLRIDSFSVELADQIQKIRKTGFTFAIEAGTERLRNVVNKPISDTDCLQTVEHVFNAGWQLVKLYLMIGLPTETEAELLGLVNLLTKIGNLAKSAPTKNAKVHIAISPFVPKAHTPFQWFGQVPMQELNRRIHWINSQVHHSRIELKWQEVQQSYLEAVFARGDRKLGQVIYRAWQKGCKFDSWTDQFRFNYWQDAFVECNIDPDRYALTSREFDEVLPWEHIDVGVTKEYLQQEYTKSLYGERVPDCWIDQCNQCGIRDCPTIFKNKSEIRNPKSETNPKSQILNLKSEITSSRWKMRVKFAKHAPVRFIAHLDLMKTFITAINRAKLPIAYSRGFNPQPRLSFASALSLGYTSCAEYLECEISEYVSPPEFLNRLAVLIPNGIELLDSWIVLFNVPALSSLVTAISYQVQNLPNDIDFTTLQQKIEQVEAEKEIVIQRQQQVNKTTQADIRPFISQISVTYDLLGKPKIELSLRKTDKGSVRPTEVMSLLLGTPEESIKLLHIKKTGLYYTLHGKYYPLDRVGEESVYRTRKTVQLIE